MAAAGGISQEDLMRLTMKMKNRMSALEAERVVTMAKNATLLAERRHLLELIRSATPVAGVLDEQDLDVASIQAAWSKWHGAGQEQLENLAQEVARLQSHHQQQQQQQQQPQSEGISGFTAAAQEDSGLQASLLEAQARLRKLDAECERLKEAEGCLQRQADETGKALEKKSAALEALKKEFDVSRAQMEEKMLMVQMQSNSIKSQLEARDREARTASVGLEIATAQLKSLQHQAEERDGALKSNKELVAALQARLMDIEPELERATARLKEQTRIAGAQTLLKAEQEALLSSLRRDLKAALDARDASTKQVAQLDAFRSKYEQTSHKVAALNEQVADLQAAADEKVSTITRLRAEAQASERNHAMRTAMLATCEAQLETLRNELLVRADTSKVAVERAAALQMQLAASEARLSERVAESSRRIEQLEGEAKQQAAEAAQQLAVQATQHEAALEGAKREFAKKSGMARSLLQEKEEEVRVLMQRVADLQTEISSGAPSERRIFELARVQSQREATHSVHTDTREVAFTQLQQALSSKDLQLAQAQASQSQLAAEVAELRRTVRREGVNMDYLKNIVLQVRPTCKLFLHTQTIPTHTHRPTPSLLPLCSTCLSPSRRPSASRSCPSSPRSCSLALWS